jgi:hypothetical protein
MPLSQIIYFNLDYGILLNVIKAVNNCSSFQTLLTTDQQNKKNLYKLILNILDSEARSENMYLHCPDHELVTKKINVIKDYLKKY